MGTSFGTGGGGNDGNGINSNSFFSGGGNGIPRTGKSGNDGNGINSNSFFSGGGDGITGTGEDEIDVGINDTNGTIFSLILICSRIIVLIYGTRTDGTIIASYCVKQLVDTSILYLL